MAKAALRTGAAPRQLSFKHTLQIWLAWSGRRYFSSGAALLNVRRVVGVQVGEQGFDGIEPLQSAPSGFLSVSMGVWIDFVGFPSNE